MVFTIQGSFNSNHHGVSFAEALKMTKFGKFHYFLILVCGLFIGSTFFETMGINYVLPVAECDLGITSKSQYGLISGIWFAGIILTSHSWGILSDAYGRKKMLIIASLSAFIASILSSLAANLWQMMVFRFINGLCISGATSIVFAYLGEFLTDKNRSRSMMVASVLFGGCCLALPLMAWLLINQKWNFDIPIIGVTYKPWRFFLVACGSLSLICGLALFFFPESPKFTFSQGNEQKTLKILKKIYKINTGNDDYKVIKLKPNEEFGDNSKGKNVLSLMCQQTSSLFSNYTRSIIIVSIMQFGIYFVCNGMLLFFPHILNQTSKFMDENANVTDTHICEIVETAIKIQKEQQVLQTEQICIDELAISAYYYTMILESCYVIGFLLISWLVNYTGRLAIFSFIFFTTSFCGFTLNSVGPAIGVYLYVWLLACGMNYTLLSTVTYDLFPTNLRSLAMSLSLMCGRLGSLVGGNIAGFLLENYCGITFTVSGVVLLLSGILTFFIPNIMKKNAENCFTQDETSIKCQYGTVSTYYRCTLTLNNPHNLNNFTTIDGNHISGKTNAHVTQIYGIGTTTTSNIPSIMCDTFPNAITIDMSSNSIQFIDKNSFSSCSKLVSLIISSNRISRIEENSFENLANLATLNLNFNHLEKIPANIFNPLVNLANLQLQNNWLQIINTDIFGTHIKLTQINLQNNIVNAIGISIIHNTAVSTLSLAGNDCINRNLLNIPQIVMRQHLEKCLENYRQLEMTTSTTSTSTTLPSENCPSTNIVPRICQLEENSSDLKDSNKELTRRIDEIASFLGIPSKEVDEIIDIADE